MAKNGSVAGLQLFVDSWQLFVCQLATKMAQNGLFLVVFGHFLGFLWCFDFFGCRPTTDLIYYAKKKNIILYIIVLPGCQSATARVYARRLA